MKPINSIEITKADLAVVGEAQAGTRLYPREGPLEEVSHWFDYLVNRWGAMVNLGGVMIYCPVSRPALHERIQRGGLTVFQFTVTERQRNLLGRVKTVFRKTYSYTPLSECHAWRDEIEERARSKGVSAEEIDRGKPGWLGAFLESERHEEESARRTRRTKFPVTLTQSQADKLEAAAQKLGFQSPAHLGGEVLGRIIDGGFSGYTFAKAGLWMMNIINKSTINQSKEEPS